MVFFMEPALELGGERRLPCFWEAAAALSPGGGLSTGYLLNSLLHAAGSIYYGFYLRHSDLRMTYATVVANLPYALLCEEHTSVAAGAVFRRVYPAILSHVPGAAFDRGVAGVRPAAVRDWWYCTPC